MRLLLIEDDSDFAATLQEELADFYYVDAAADGRSGMYLAETSHYDLIILDAGLPDMDGLDICTELRRRGITIPILFLTGRGSLADKVSGLNAGADDYLVKPFELSELLARLQALIRRSSGPALESVLSYGSLQLDTISRTVTHQGQPVSLRRKEFELLELLLRHQGQLVTRQMILDYLWDSNANSFTSAIDVHASHLRKRIDKTFGTALIETVYGLGYRLGPSRSRTPRPYAEPA